jgi:hypothetical protein
MKSKDFLLTVAVSVATTLVVTEMTERSTIDRLLAADQESVRELTVDRLIVRDELIVSDTGEPWEKGFEQHQIPRGAVIRSLAAGPDGKPGIAGLWVRSRLIKSEIDDPFDDRFHAINRDGTIFRAPGHISWNVWLDDAWRQMAIIQGEGVENSELSSSGWTGGNHPGRIRFQSFRPNHQEPLTDVMMGQGMMSIGGGGYGGGGLPYASEVLQIWGGSLKTHSLPKPEAPRLVRENGSGPHRYAIVAIGPQGDRSELSEPLITQGLATLEWDSVPGADAYVVVRDGEELTGLLRIEGSKKQWTDQP